jgi:hypothetical protein
VDGTGPDLKFNAVQSLYAWEILAYPMHLQNIFISQFLCLRFENVGTRKLWYPLVCRHKPSEIIN